jgi:formate hydrogenlyase subunit 3/multisubunit Na+/H+ antiporter MnhD subunit
MIFAAATGTADNLIIVALVLMVVVGVGWKMYMATFRTEDYLKLERHNEEAKERRAARLEKAGGFVSTMIQLFWKKK